MVNQPCPQLQLYIKESQYGRLEEGKVCTLGLGRMGLDHEAGDELLWNIVGGLSQQEGLWRRPGTSHQNIRQKT